MSEKVVPEVPEQTQAVSSGDNRKKRKIQESPRIWWGLVLQFLDFSVSTDEVPPVPKVLEHATVKKNLAVISKKFVFQLERGDLGTQHYQCLIGLKHKERKSTLIKKLASILSIAETCISCEPKSGWDFAPYCMKDDTRVAGPWGSEISDPPKLLETSKFYPWQKKVYDMVTQTVPDDRTIHWYWDSCGATGKTLLCKKLCYENQAFLFSGKASDISSRIVQLQKPPKICIANIPRQQEQFVSYQAVECLKDGLVSTGKYEGGQRVFDSPHVVIFANFAPDRTKMSKDRWKVVELAKLQTTTPSIIPTESTTESGQSTRYDLRHGMASIDFGGVMSHMGG